MTSGRDVRDFRFDWNVIGFKHGQSSNQGSIDPILPDWSATDANSATRGTIKGHGRGRDAVTLGAPHMLSYPHEVSSLAVF